MAAGMITDRGPFLWALDQFIPRGTPLDDRIGKIRPWMEAALSGGFFMFVVTPLLSYFGSYLPSDAASPVLFAEVTMPLILLISTAAYLGYNARLAYRRHLRGHVWKNGSWSATAQILTSKQKDDLFLSFLGMNAAFIVFMPFIA